VSVEKEEVEQKERIRLSTNSCSSHNCIFNQKRERGWSGRGWWVTLWRRLPFGAVEDEAGKPAPFLEGLSH
jgi:hypothetical protein